MTEGELMRAYRRSASEDELLTTVAEALTLAGWLWTHVRRSDRAQTMGTAGWPDIFAVHPTRHLALALELKAHRGSITDGQGHWMRSLNAVGIPAAIVNPDNLDSILAVIIDSAKVIDSPTLDREDVAKALRA